eukprot:jgi/Psemu1/16714/gm1.16714_g
MGSKKQQQQQQQRQRSLGTEISRQHRGNAKSSDIPGKRTKGTSNRDSLPGIIWALFTSLLKCGIWLAISSPFWLLAHSLLLIYGRPPNLVYLSQTLRYLGFVWVQQATNASDAEQQLEPFAVSQKIYLSATIIVHTICSPISAFAWIVDELLYGRRLSRLEAAEQAALEHPVFVVSAFRSASTQLARSLVAKTHYKQGSNGQIPFFVAPNAMMCAYPYLWLWKLMYAIVGDIPDTLEPGNDGGLTKDDVKQKFNAGFTHDSLARHPNDPFQTDTFDGTFLNCHLNGLAWHLCRAVPTSLIEQEFNYAYQKDSLNKQIWQRDMVRHIDRLARKTLVFCSEGKSRGQGPTPQRFLLKGHFLSIGPQLQALYGRGARFITILRDPCARLRSGINYMAVNPTLYANDPTLQIPWNAFAKVLQETEAQYCERELEWFGNDCSDDNKKKEDQDRLALTFDSFVVDSDKTIGEIMDWLRLRSDEDEVTIAPSSADGGAKNKSPRRKKAGTTSAAPSKTYRIDRSLQELGVDEKAYRGRLADYLSWMKEVSKGNVEKRKSE